MKASLLLCNTKLQRQLLIIGEYIIQDGPYINWLLLKRKDRTVEEAAKQQQLWEFLTSTGFILYVQRSLVSSI